MAEVDATSPANQGIKKKCFSIKNLKIIEPHSPSKVKRFITKANLQSKGQSIWFKEYLNSKSNNSEMNELKITLEQFFSKGNIESDKPENFLNDYTYNDLYKMGKLVMDEKDKFKDILSHLDNFINTIRFFIKDRQKDKEGNPAEVKKWNSLYQFITIPRNIGSCSNLHPPKKEVSGLGNFFKGKSKAKI